MPLIDPRAYDAKRAEWIALEYATGEPFTGLSDLHRAFPETVPPPVVIRRWRSTFPAFDALMAEAEQARAVALMEATLPIADSVTLNAAQAKNAITARWRLAEALSPETFGARKTEKPPGDDDARTLLGSLTDAALMRIMAGADPRALLQIAPGTPPPPPAAERPGLSGVSEVIPPSRTHALLEGSAGSSAARESTPGVPRETAGEREKSVETSG